MAQAKATPTAAGSANVDDEEALSILSEYMMLVDSHFSQYKYYLARNSVVDWFGRSIRGPPKIYQYMRYEVFPQYNHINFLAATKCEPIETKPTHFKTVKVSCEDVDHLVPPGAKGLVTLRLYSDREFERNMEALGLSSLIKRPTTPRAESRNSSDDERTPSPKAAPVDEDVAMESEDSDAGISGVARGGYFHDEHYLIPYTPLRYIEVTGILRGYADKLAKPPNVSSESPGKDESTGNWWDRPVRIRLSYRRRISDQHIEFALIIYENVNWTPENPNNLRRNLMLEFNQVGNNETVEPADEHEYDVENFDMENPEAISNGFVSNDTENEDGDNNEHDSNDLHNDIENIDIDAGDADASIATNEIYHNELYTVHTDNNDDLDSEDGAGAVGATALIAPSRSRSPSPPLPLSLPLPLPISEDDEPVVINPIQTEPLSENIEGETVIGTVTTPNSDEIAQAFEMATAFTIVPMRTPTKTTPETPATPKRKPRNMSSMKRLNLTPSAPPPKRNAARNLRL